MNATHACEEEKERGLTVMATESDTHRWEVKVGMDFVGFLLVFSSLLPAVVKRASRRGLSSSL